MKNHRFFNLFIALLIAVSTTLATQIIERTVSIAQSPQQTHVTLHEIESQATALSARRIEYFVAPDGNNNNPGTEALPWRTIQKAADNLIAGDTVYIKNGTYYERVLPARSGALYNYITYSAYPGHNPIIDGSGVPTGYKGLFEVQDKSYIIISGLTVRDSTTAAIHVRKSDHIIIRDNHTQESKSSGIGIWNSNNIIVDGNVIVNAVNASTGYEECITIASVENFEVKNNEVYSVDNGNYKGAGIDVKDSSSFGQVYKNVIHDLPNSGIYIDAWDGYNHDHEIFQNYIYNTGSGISLGAESGGTVRYLNIYNNVIYHVSFAGITLQQSGDDGPRRDIHIFNNTIVESYSHGGAGILVKTYNAYDIVLTNNLVNFGPDTTSGQIKAYNPQEIVSITNLVYGPKEQTQDLNLVEITAGTIDADPKFVDKSTQDFRLQRESPAVNSGSDVGLGFDFADIKRPQVKKHDIGAYERLPDLVMSHFPADQALHLKWKLNDYSLPSNSTWQISYANESDSTVYTLVNIADNTVRAYTLTGLSNYAWYNVTLNAMLDGAPLLTDTMRIMPTDKFWYYPLVAQ